MHGMREALNAMIRGKADALTIDLIKDDSDFILNKVASNYTKCLRRQNYYKVSKNATIKLIHKKM